VTGRIHLLQGSGGDSEVDEKMQISDAEGVQGDSHLVTAGQNGREAYEDREFSGDEAFPAAVPALVEAHAPVPITCWADGPRGNKDARRAPTPSLIRG
jgi:hypothetical protein